MLTLNFQGNIASEHEPVKYLRVYKSDNNIILKPGYYFVMKMDIDNETHVVGPYNTIEEAKKECQEYFEDNILAYVDCSAMDIVEETP